MLFIILISVVLILSMKIVDVNVKYLGEVSSLKLALKEKEKEIDKLKSKIEEIKNLDVNVEV